ncbi:histidine phosphatase family protein [Xylocopilactobacillus apicola]|uniref:Phosphoglycerate mutase n=1 Tax=Xylocopilactobacillus apicola TaxID=2932184 RepID=A0AAU9DF89_9LACO|nr:histidine phosphatase family protein [Xylocopilactobacillus apicola]BDR58590.1 phosphoglycerate mutase [Xylocopilactobacillus apicola]
MNTTIYLVRHGETTANVMGLVQGWCDFTLTEQGLLGAEYLGRGMKDITFSAAYSGDLTRQEKTAREALKYSGNAEVPLQITSDLREGNYGSYEGRKFPEIAQYYGYESFDVFLKSCGPLAQNKMQDFYYQADQKNLLNTNLPEAYRAESSAAVEKRMSNCISQIVKKEESAGGGNILVVSSGMSINLFLHQAKIPEYTGTTLKNDAVTKVVYQAEKFKLSGEIGSLEYFERGQEDLK